MADGHAATFKAAYAKAAMVTCTVENWDELDYTMNQYPLETSRLEAFYNCRRL